MAVLHGVSHRTLRFYEQKGLLQPVRVGTQRLFTEQDRTCLDAIMLAKRLGFSLLEIQALIKFRRSGEAHGAQPSVASFGLSKTEIGARIVKLEHERDRVERALDELRRAKPNAPRSTR